MLIVGKEEGRDDVTMRTPEERLTGIADELRRGVTPAGVTVRVLLEWFGAARRGTDVVRRIRGALAQAGLETLPDFEGAYIDAPLVLVGADSKHPDDVVSPSYRINSLDSANRKPQRVAPDDALDAATTIMLANEFSQLPVMTSDREVKGVVSWRSIGSCLALGKTCSVVRECMESAQVIDEDASLFDAIAIVARLDYVLVRATDKCIKGIVTSSDLSQQFSDLAEPFLVIGEIENLVRRLINGKFTVDQLQQVRDPGDADRVVSGVSDLTFGEYIRLLEHPDRWKGLNVRVDRARFVDWLKKVRDVRNDVMHFDPQGSDPESLDSLRKFVGFLRNLHRRDIL